MQRTLFFCLTLAIFAITLVRVDRLFFKNNHSFNIRYIYSTLPTTDLPSRPMTSECEQALNQPFTYLTKGHQTFVFESADHKYILKVNRFPSHLRKLPWLTHPLGYLFSSERLKIKAYNEDKLDLTLKSYQIAFNELREESGLLYIHDQKTSDLNKTLTLIDRQHTPYEVVLDELIFIVQKKCDLIYPTLQQYIQNGDLVSARQMIDSIVQLLASTAQKGIQDKDAMLEKNYGCLGTHAIHLDIGRFVKNDQMKEPEVRKVELAKITENLKFWLESNAAELLPFYKEKLEEPRS